MVFHFISRWACCGASRQKPGRQVYHVARYASEPMPWWLTRYPGGPLLDPKTWLSMPKPFPGLRCLWSQMEALIEKCDDWMISGGKKNIKKKTMDFPYDFEMLERRNACISCDGKTALDVDLDPDFIQIHWIVRVWGMGNGCEQRWSGYSLGFNIFQMPLEKVWCLKLKPGSTNKTSSIQYIFWDQFQVLDGSKALHLAWSLARHCHQFSGHHRLGVRFLVDHLRELVHVDST